MNSYNFKRCLNRFFSSEEIKSIFDLKGSLTLNLYPRLGGFSILAGERKALSIIYQIEGKYFNGDSYHDLKVELYNNSVRKMKVIGIIDYRFSYKWESPIKITLYNTRGRTNQESLPKNIKIKV